MKGHVERLLNQVIPLTERSSQVAERSGKGDPSGRSATLAPALRRSTRTWTGIRSCMAATWEITRIRLGQYLTEHALARGYQVTGVCRPESVGKLAHLGDRITVFPGSTDDRTVIARATQGCDGVLTVLAPWGVRDYASGTTRAVLDLAPPEARLVFSCGWHVSRDGQDRYGWKIRAIVRFGTPILRALRLVDLDDQQRAAELILASGRDWTLVRGADLEEGPSEGLPVRARHARDPGLARNLMRRTDFALFMVAALTDPTLIREAPAITGQG